MLTKKKKSGAIKKLVKGAVMKKMMHRMDESKKHEMSKKDIEQDKGEY